MKKANTRDLQQVQLEIMSYVDDYCRKNGIRYSLYGGTLIGAIRHKGFIPWDDDIDIMMERSDYDKFVKSFNNQDSSYKLAAFEIDSNYPYPFAKISDNRTKLNERIYRNYPLGINIDVFPVEYLPYNQKKLRLIYLKQSILHMMLNVKLLTDLKSRKIGKIIILILSFVLLMPFTRKFIIRQMMKNANHNKDNDIHYMGDVLGGYGIKEVLEKTDFDNYIDLDFEGHRFMAIQGYDHYLKNVFGDYMKLPPINQRITHHHFDAFI